MVIADKEKSGDVPVLVVGTKSCPALSDAQTPKPKNHVKNVSAKGEDVAVSVPSVGQVVPRAPSVQKSNGSGKFNPMNKMPSPCYRKPGPKRNSNTNGTPHIDVPAYALPPGSGPYPNGENPKPVSPVAAGQESMEGRKIIQSDLHQIDLNESVSVPDPSEHSMEQQQEKTGTDIIESGRAVAILNSNDNNIATLNSNKNNLIQAESVPEESHVAKRGRKERVRWTEDEHKLFLKGLEKYGKGRWKDISKEFVVTKTPIQLAGHAQKYFIHQNVKDTEKRKKRRSIHDTTFNKNGTLVTLVEQQSEIPPQGMQQTQTQQNEISPMLCLLCPISSTIPDKEKLEKMRDLLAKEL